MEKIRLALDWAPNTVHAGILLAVQSRLLEEMGIELELLSPEIDGYEKKPIEYLADDEVDLALSPTEHLFTCVFEQNLPFKGIATIFQKEISALVAKDARGFKKPADIDGKIYAGYRTVFEKEFISTIIKNDGGNGEFRTELPPRLSVWNTFMQNEADFCWVFMNWEGMMAKQAGVKLNQFKLSENGIPYGHSPILMAKETYLNEKKGLIERLLKGLALAHQQCYNKPDQIAEFLSKEIRHPNFETESLISDGLEYMHDYLLDANQTWGHINLENTVNFYKYLASKKLMQPKTEEEIKALFVGLEF